MKVNAKSLDENIPQELNIYDMEFSIQVANGSTEKKKQPKTIKGIGEKLGVAVRSNVTHIDTDWHLVPGELLKLFNDKNPYLKKPLTEEQRLEELYYKPCSNCGAQWKIGCCSA